MNVNRLKMLIKNKELSISFLVILFCIILGLVFPASNTIEEITRSIFFFVALPVLYIKFVLKKDISDFGFNIENNKYGLLWGAANLAIIAILFYALIKLTPFEKNYRLSTYASNKFWIFIIYELVFVNISIFINEFFFRGFILNIFSKKLGFISIAIQSALCISIAVIAESSVWQVAPLLIFSVTGGITAYKTKSFIYSYFSELLAIIILDAYIIHLVR